MGTADLTSLSRGGGSGGPNQAISTSARGRVEGAPASDTEAMVVVVPEFSSVFPYQVPPSQWEHSGTLPARGAQCLVIFDDAGDAWVPIWDGMTVGGGGGATEVFTGPEAPTDRAELVLWIDTDAEASAGVGGGDGNVDGGRPDSVYGAIPVIDGGTVS